MTGYTFELAGFDIDEYPFIIALINNSWVIFDVKNGLTTGRFICNGGQVLAVSNTKKLMIAKKSS